MLNRVRRRLNAIRFRLAARNVHHTPPMPCDSTAACTIHTMLGHGDFLMYLVAIKSFLRFRPAARVLVHSDGSVTPNEEATLRQHVPGIRFVSTAEADERARKELNPFLLEWRAVDPCWRRVIDTELWCETPRRIIMDSDILTLRKPDAVLDWIANGADNRPLMFGAREEVPTGPIPEGTGKRHVQTVFREKLAAIAAGAGRPAVFCQGATAGYYGCGRELPLTEVERVIRAGVAAGVPLTEWGGDQCLVVYLLSTSNPVRLDPEKYVNFSPADENRMGEVAVAHFYGTVRYSRGVYPRLAREVVREMKTTPV